MIQSPKKLLTLIKNNKIIRNLSERELFTPEGVGFDLRLGSLSQISAGGGYLGTDTRRTPNSISVDPTNGVYTLIPNKVYLATTVEEFSLPSNLAADFFPRSTLFRSGIIFQSSILPPGYDGPMTFALTNLHTEDFKIEVGSRFCHVVIQMVTKGSRGYEGQWQGGRISQPSDEEQN